MKWFETAVAYLFPAVLIDSTPWRELWEKQQREQFTRYSLGFFSIAAVGYVANYFLFDLPMNLQPRQFWLNFRLAMTALCLLNIAFYWSNLANTKYYRIPAIISCSIFCYTQAKVTVWFSVDAWFFFFLFVLGTVMYLRMTAFYSFLYGLALCVFCAPILIESGVPIEYIVTSSITTFVISAVVRLASLTEVRNFLLAQENDAAQKQIIAMNVEYADRVKSFIPKVIAERMNHLMEQERKTVVEASIEALKARKKEIACIFTDIRGFTQGSKDMDLFIRESVFPEVSACSNAIEAHRGIPRKIGDLIFAYFDDQSIHLNVVRAIVAGIEVARVNESMNATSTAKEIRRYILISSGEAIVGNFGGLDTSIEITALGSPVNFLSRVDELTKNPSLSAILNSGDLLLSENAMRTISELKIDMPIDRIDLRELSLEVRDFPETESLYRLTPNDEIYEISLKVASMTAESSASWRDQR